MDVSRYTDSHEEVRAYGYTEGVGVVVVEDTAEDQTTFVVVRGGIRQDYGYDDASLSRSEVFDHIDMLKSPAPNLPEDIELTWVESEEEIREHVVDIFGAFNKHTQQSVSQEQVTEAAERYGISPHQTETAIETLKSEEVITESDDGLRLADGHESE